MMKSLWCKLYFDMKIIKVVFVNAEIHSYMFACYIKHKIRKSLVAEELKAYCFVDSMASSVG